MKAEINIEDINLNMPEQISYISGKGFWYLFRGYDGEEDVVDVRFPRIIAIKKDEEEGTIKYYPIVRDFELDFMDTEIRTSCYLSHFEKILPNYIDANLNAEDLIYEFEAHDIKLHPAIYRKYQPNK